MTTNAITTYLKYANLQMAAEAVDLSVGLTGTDLAEALQVGNNRSSTFPAALAESFSSKWKVVAYQDNTDTGFSGTVFECVAADEALGYKTGEKVVSFRSTEFIDDGARDNQATNVLEVSKFGWAFGQIADMKKWVDGLYENGTLSSRRLG